MSIIHYLSSKSSNNENNENNSNNNNKNNDDVESDSNNNYPNINGQNQPFQNLNFDETFLKDRNHNLQQKECNNHIDSNYTEYHHCIIIDNNNNNNKIVDQMNINNKNSPPYVTLVQNEDDIEGQEKEDSALNSSSTSSCLTKHAEQINCSKIEIVRSRPKQSKFRISFIVLFKSCFGRGPMMMRILSALFFAISSFLLVVINKIVLTTYHFPSVMILGLGQVAATIIILNIFRRLNIIKFPYYSREVNAKMFPLPIFYLGNLVAGLGSTKRLNLPMLTVLRRFTILMTMIGEFYLLGINQSLTIKMTVFMMIGGAIIAASNDLAFDAAGYAYVLFNDVFSTFNGIYMKKKLDSRDLGKYGILYYNALFIVVPLFIISLCVDDWRQCFWEFEHWTSPMFILSFLMSCMMGFILMYSTALCTQYNSALTTTIVGCLKNILVTFIGMYIGGDYIFSTVNFIGLNLSMIGSLIYSYVIFVHKPSSSSTSCSTASLSVKQ